MKWLIIIFLLAFNLNCFSQKTGNGINSAEYRTIVDMPTAGTLPKGYYALNVTYFSAGGLATDFAISPFANFLLALSFSGSGIVGDGEPEFQSLPGIRLSYRIIDEKLTFPAILLGISTQGKGGWLSNEKRFQTMSPGAFLAVSKAFSWQGGLMALHGGLNYSFEPLPADRMLNFYAGAEQLIGSVLSIALEYNSNLDEKENQILSKRGMVNASIRCIFSKGLTLELQARDLFRHLKGANGFSRYIALEYTASF